jgi:N-acetylglucosaminyldiphosphoundecaprenol N-acetyl-beta-D-mannosaminyltransferase
MIDRGKRNVLGIGVDVCDYDGAVERIIGAATNRQPLAMSALAVHGIMTGVGDAEHRQRLNELDLVTPDGQPVRWGLNLLHRAHLADRVYGPTLSLHVLQRAEAEGLAVCFYGSTPDVLAQLEERLAERHPSLVIAGLWPSQFASAGPDVCEEIAARIRASGARICFVGLGCPRQEVFAWAMRDRLGMPTLAVGAAFDYHAGSQTEPPQWVQRRGLQWLWRLAAEPRRLWRRYLLLNPAYLALLAAQRLGVWRPRPGGRPPDPTAAVPI